jgi:hypothetical protein
VLLAARSQRSVALRHNRRSCTSPRSVADLSHRRLANTSIGCDALRVPQPVPETTIIARPHVLRAPRNVTP